MIGRDRELGVLTGIWERVVDEGRSPACVTVFGPAGIGKSRIALELAQLVAGQGARAIRGRSTPYGASSPYSAFAQQVKQTARIFDSDEPAEASEKLAALRSPRSRGLQRRGGARAAVSRRFSASTASGRPADREHALLLRARLRRSRSRCAVRRCSVYEDIHWADGSLLDLLETFGARVRDVPVLFVALARPELLGERPGLGRRPPRVHGAPARAARRQLRATSSPRQLLAASSSRAMRAAKVAETAEGNPLFIEELAALHRRTEAEGLDELPTSIRAIIAARLDALPATERAVLVDASVVGRVFWRGALSEIEDRADLSEALGSLEDRDLIQREAVSRIRGDQQFAFKHGLIHDVAYATLPRAARRAKHAAVARYLEATTDVGQSHEALAHHWREAGEGERAVEHLVAAATRPGAAGRRSEPSCSTAKALELVGEDDATADATITRRRPSRSRRSFHLDDVGRPAGEPG